MQGHHATLPHGETTPTALLPHPHNRNETLQFIDRLSNLANVTWQTFSDKKKEAARDPLARILHGCNQTILQQLDDLNDKGAGVFVMVNEGTGTGRTSADVVRVRSLVLDLDGAPLDPVLACQPSPHIVVESSPKRYHCYWLVHDCPLSDFKPLQKALAARFNGDRSVCDLARVMRVPGFRHLKNANEPFLTRIIGLSDEPSYGLEQLITGLQLDLSGQPAPPRAPTANPERNYLWRDHDTGEEHDLRTWAATYRGFKLASALRKKRPAVLLGPAMGGRQHIQCVNGDQHTNKAFDNATFVMDAQDSDTGSFIYCCMHDHCRDLDRLSVISKMLEQGWLTWADLTGKQFNIITEQKHPGFVKFDADHVFGTLQLLSPRLQKDLLMLGVSSLRKSFGGILPDNDFRTALLLGITEAEWQEEKDTFVKLGLVTHEAGELQVNYFHDRYQEASESYINAAIAGSRGGNANHGSRT